MRKYFCMIFLVVIHGIILGQTAEEKVIQMKDSALQEDDTAVDSRPAKVSWDLSLGTGFVHMPKVGSGMVFHAAPMMTLPLSARWSLHGGVMAMRYQGLGPSLMQENGKQHVFSSLALFAAASCRMNDRLILHGTGVKQLVSSPVAPFIPPDNLSFGATYRLGNNITIGATIHMNQGHGYLSSPFYGGGLYPPLQGSGLYPPYTW